MKKLLMFSILAIFASFVVPGHASQEVRQVLEAMAPSHSTDSANEEELPSDEVSVAISSADGSFLEAAPVSKEEIKERVQQLLQGDSGSASLASESSDPSGEASK